ncbi:protein FAM117A isoform X3 [Macaca thibetana thibetana]|uniref:protein FAM117A isoform X5 n=1 Tax=Papio anubis TaxID=9555 RepID=UPI0005F3725C|nr:protein FAM117A isoform X4 [Macaca nemestrina]XP_021784681.1 protein FAM117A isoform X5 [Papio anubis]XP_028692219.1 protein FAM117A isoform X4 [Macaca mulatta]XP_045230912.1 protein FAM117A isoform X4 [Macaca fascicularis]XP_050621622.1 protein FAM117A isoform X3 [Macaca thibetana thibetana]
MAGAAAGGRGGGAWGPGRGGSGGLRRGCSPPAPAGSPRAGLQPLRATIPFQLQQPHQRRDGGGRAASVPCSVAPEKSVSRPQPLQVRRTFSLDTILSSYLLGQWPRDADGAFTCCTNDKATQISKLKQQLQRTKLSRSGKEKERGSPLPGDHAVRGALRASPPSFPSGSPVLRLSPCLHRSLEGLNQELEEVFVKEQGEEELLRILEIPDGHRAPAPPQSGSCDHPLLLLEPGNLASSPSMSLASPQPCGPASHEEHRGAAEELASTPNDKASSPGHPAFLEDGSPSPVLAFAASPRPNHSYVFKREPPEGCEKVRVFEEATSPGPDLAFLTSCPDKNKVHFNPTGSAFCPVSLMKPLFPGMGFIFRNCPSNPGSPLPPASPRPPPRKDPEASKASPLPFEPWQRTPPSEESVLFQSSLMV